MKSNPIAVAVSAKGPYALYRRARSISGRYGFTAAHMNLALQRFADVLHRFNCGATFPITAVTLKRHGNTIAKYLDQNIEFAVHGYTHADYAQLAPEAQLAHLCLARDVFAEAGISAVGFRSPYLRREDHLYTAIEAAGFSYVSNQPFMWDVLDGEGLASTSDYKRAIAFYKPWLASDRTSLPQLSNQLVEIPVSLPDDEILIDRLGGANGLVKETWQRILAQTHQRGELFTLQLHPERITLCAEGLSAVLTEARALAPTVWCARLDEIAAWWRTRAEARVEVTSVGDNGFHVTVAGPKTTTLLVRAVEVDAPTSLWVDGYRQVGSTAFTVRATCRPVIGLSPGTSPQWADWLHQQGYVVELSRESQNYSIYLDQSSFAEKQGFELVAQIERTNRPLVRLGRWPNGAKSALAVTGDIDALTLWDYGLRFLGR